MKLCFSFLGFLGKRNKERLSSFKEKKKGNDVLFVGTMGPSPVPLANRPSPRAPKGLGPKASQPRNARPILHLGTLKGLGLKPSRPRNAQPNLRPGTLKGLGLKASRPRNARSILRPGAQVPHIPDAFLPRCLLSRLATPPNEVANRLFMLQV